jgi:Leucine-rich repeat (LRR) protein
MDAKHIQDIQERVNVNFLGEVRLYNAKITSDVLKGLIFPEDAESIDLSRNQITTLEGVTFPEKLEHLDLSRNQITTLEGVTFPSTLRTLNLSDNPNLTLTGVNDLSALGWRKYRSGARMGELNLRGTKVTLKGDVCFIKNIPEPSFP